MVRAIAQGKLDTTAGCEPSVPIQYLLKENMIVREVEREAAVAIRQAFHAQHVAGMQVFGVGSTLIDSFYKHHFASGMYHLNLLANELMPWSEQWKKQADKFKADIDASSGSGAMKLSNNQVLDLIHDFELMRTRWEAAQMQVANG